jgi:hypothetical protein
MIGEAKQAVAAGYAGPNTQQQQQQQAAQPKLGMAIIGEKAFGLLLQLLHDAEAGLEQLLQQAALLGIQVPDAADAAVDNGDSLNDHADAAADAPAAAAAAGSADTTDDGVATYDKIAEDAAAATTAGATAQSQHQQAQQLVARIAEPRQLVAMRNQQLQDNQAISINLLQGVFETVVEERVLLDLGLIGQLGAAAAAAGSAEQQCTNTDVAAVKAAVKRAEARHVTVFPLYLREFCGHYAQQQQQQQNNSTRQRMDAHRAGVTTLMEFFSAVSAQHTKQQQQAAAATSTAELEAREQARLASLRVAMSTRTCSLSKWPRSCSCCSRRGLVTWHSCSSSCLPAT